MFPVTRREALIVGGASIAAAALGTAARTAEPQRTPDAFRYCFNTSTIMGQKLPLPDEIEIAAKAGYQAIEPWVSKIREFVESGGRLPELKKRIADLGISVESSVAFSDWMSAKVEQSPNGLDQWKRDFELVSQLGGRRICAPPAGSAEKDLLKVAARYRRLLAAGREFGVTPQLELWGRSQTLRRLGDVAYVIAETGKRDACAVLDVFHIYTGESNFDGLRAFNANSLHVFHLNDYPAEPPREKITDASRVYPGDGVAPLGSIIHSLAGIGFCGFLSLELFSQKYWKQDPALVARTGLKKMKAVVSQALK